MTPAARKPRLDNFSFSVTKLMMLGMMINKVHQPSKKTLRLNSPSALPPKITPSAIMATPQMIGLICFMLTPLRIL